MIARAYIFGQTNGNLYNEESTMIIDFDQLSPSEIYYAMVQTVIPRPIAWVLSENESNGFNLAPFSYFTAISSNPPLMMYSVGKKPEGMYKDSLVNVEKRKELVIHIAPAHMAAEVTESAKGLAYDQSELALIDAELTDFEGFRLPRLKDCPIAFGCTLHEVTYMGELPMALVFAEVKQVYIDDAVAGKDDKNRLKVDAMKVNPLSRLGGSEYAFLGGIDSVARPK